MRDDRYDAAQRAEPLMLTVQRSSAAPLFVVFNVRSGGRDARETQQQVERREDRAARDAGQVTRDQYRTDRRQDRREYRQDRRQDQRQLRRENRRDRQPQ